MRCRFAAVLAYDLWGTNIVHINRDHRYVDAERASGERQGKVLLDHRAEPARLLFHIIAIDGGLRSTCPIAVPWAAWPWRFSVCAFNAFSNACGRSVRCRKQEARFAAPACS